MEENYATKIHQSKSAMYGYFNAVVSVLSKKGKLVTLDAWINPEVISNILSIPILGKSCYHVTYDTK